MKRTPSRMKLFGLLAVIAVFCAACDPGWTNPILGTGDGSGTTPGSVAVASSAVALGSPGPTVDLGAKGYLVYDGTNCTIVQVTSAGATRFAGNGTCGKSGDGGPANQASIDADNRPQGSGLQVDGAGNVYFLDMSSGSNSGTIREISATSGTISTLPSIVPSTPGGFIVDNFVVDPDGTIVALATSTASTGMTVPYNFYRSNGTANATLIATADSATRLPLGFVRTGDDSYSALSSNGSSMIRIDVNNSGATTTPISFPGAFVAESVDSAGSIYGIEMSNTFPFFNGDKVVRLRSDNTVDTIGGTGTVDPANARQQNMANALNLNAQWVAVTKDGNLLIASGHVVYDVVNAASAPAQ